MGRVQVSVQDYLRGGGGGTATDQRLTSTVRLAVGGVEQCMVSKVIVMPRNVLLLTPLRSLFLL